MGAIKIQKKHMAEEIFIIESETMTKFEADENVDVVYLSDCVKRIG